MADTDADTSWRAGLRSVAQALLTLEFNTLIDPDGFSAQKMPEAPLALHVLAGGYHNYLLNIGFGVSDALLADAAAEVHTGDDSSTNAGTLDTLRFWTFADRRYTKAERTYPKAQMLPGPGETFADAPARIDPTNALTNGGESFEALQWAAWAALQTIRAYDESGGVASRPAVFANVDVAVLARINATCRQLKEAALRLEQQYDDVAGTLAVPRQDGAKAMERIAAMRSGPEAALRRAAAGGGRPDGGAPAPAAGQRRLFGGTPEQTAAALFAHPRPAFDIDPDITLMIRKAWDIGTRSVVMQTTLQIDGDVTQAMARSLLDRPAEQRDFLLQLHAAATRDGIDQWKRFYELLGEIVQTIGTWLFGRR